MKVDLPALSLALSRASTGIRRTQDPSSGAVLLTAAQGLLRASRSDGHHLSDATCPCEEGSLGVAAEADRLKEFLSVCTGSVIELADKQGDLACSCGGKKVKLRGYDINRLPRHSKPPTTSKLSLSAELVDRVKWAQKLTADKIDHNSRDVEKVVLLEIESGFFRLYAQLGVTLAVWYEGEWAPEEFQQLGVNRELASLMPSGPFDLLWSDNHLGFETGDSSTYEPRVEYIYDEKKRHRKLLGRCPEKGADFDPKSLAGAISGALSVYSPEPQMHRSVVLKSDTGVLKVASRTSAGDYEAEAEFAGPSFEGRFNADLLTKIVSTLKAPSLAHKDNTLWIWEGGAKAALQGMRL